VLVGRETECAVIDDVIERARGGTAGTLVLSGEAGVGKTALLEYAVATADGMTVVRALGVQTEAEIEFSALLGLARPLLDCLPELPPPQADALRGALGLAPVDVPDRFTIGAATLSLLAAAAERRPLVVAVDDAHWLDPSSTDALVFAARRLQADRVCFLFSCRLGDESTFAVPGACSLELSGLTPDAAALLLQGRQVAPAVVEMLVRATAGNPLALIELPQLLSPDQLEGREPLPEPLPAGTTVERALARRVGALPAGAQRALLIAAVSTSSSSELVLRALASMGLAASDLELGEDAGLLTLADGRLEFRHPLVRSSVYHTAPASERRAAHRALAAACGDEGPEECAWHLAAAALGPDEEIAAALERSAVATARRSGHAGAATTLERAARLSPDEDARLRRLYEAANAAWEAGRTEHALELLREPLERTHEPRRRARVLHLRYQIERLSGSVVDAFGSLADAAELVAEVEPDQAVKILVDASEAAIYAADPEAAHAAARRARELAPTDGGVVDILADLVLGESLLYIGRPDEGNELISRAAATLERHQTLRESPRMMTRLALDLTTAHRTAEAALASSRAVALAREQGAISALCYALDASAWNDAHVGRWREAYAAASEAVELARETGLANTLVYTLCELAWIEAGRGQEEGCREHAAEALTITRANGLRFAAMYARSALALLDLGVGELERAAAELSELEQEARALPATPDGSPWADLCEVLVRLGRRDEAREMAETFAPVVGVGDHHWVAALRERSAALLASEDEFDEHFDAALAHHAHVEDAFQLARTRLAYGERLRRAGRRIEAREQLRAALELFERLGARPWSERTNGELRASGETTRRRRPYEVEELTPQELQIALQVAEGKTNKEVGAALFLSPKTVEYHLTHVYRKLEVHSRAELIRRFAAEAALAPA
jgi:DNA-binding CsgD family transcriptional regulator